MTTRRAGKKETAPAKPTVYEISVPIKDTDLGDATITLWKPVGSIETTGGARTAVRKWAESAGESFAGGAVRAVPSSMVTVVMVSVETRRQLTLGAP